MPYIQAPCKPIKHHTPCQRRRQDSQTPPRHPSLTAAKGRGKGVCVCVCARATDQGLSVHTQRRQGVVGIAPHELACDRRAHERQVSFRLVQGKLSSSAHVTFAVRKALTSIWTWRVFLAACVTSSQEVRVIWSHEVMCEVICEVMREAYLRDTAEVVEKAANLGNLKPLV